MYRGLGDDGAVGGLDALMGINAAATPASSPGVVAPSFVSSTDATDSTVQDFTVANVATMATPWLLLVGAGVILLFLLGGGR